MSEASKKQALRVDALADKGEERLLALTGDTLDRAPDDELERIVQEVAERFGAPMAMVSLVLKRTQFFRAHKGLPPDLAVAQATDRDISMCQYVVRDEAPLVVEDAEDRDELPTVLGEQYGFRSYLGSPLRIGDVVVGSLCTVDTKPRKFADADVAAITAYAERASKRLRELAAVRHRDALGDALYPAFSEVRNLLTPIQLGLSRADTASTELAAVHHVTRDILQRSHADDRVLKVLTRGDDMLADLEKALVGAGKTFDRLRSMLEALETAVTSGDATTPAGDILKTALALSHHVTKLVGGVDLVVPAPPASVAIRRGNAALFLSTVLTTVVDDASKGPQAKPQVTPVDAEGEVQFWITSKALTEALAQSIVEHLTELLPALPGVALRAKGRDVIVTMQSA